MSVNLRITNHASRRLISLGLSFATLIMVGTIGYEAIEGWSFLDSLYMTVITIATVGFREMQPPSQLGMIHTIALILLSMILIATWLGMITSVVVEGQLKDPFRRKKMTKLAEGMQNHYILCGAGLTGAPIVEEFIHHHMQLVVIEINEDRVQRLIEKHSSLPVFCSSALDDETLIMAGIHKAKGLISVLSSDTDNLFVVLSARFINPKIRIVARAFEDATLEKLLRAGADEAICPSKTSGNQIASLVLRPLASHFMEMLSSGRQGTPDVRGLHITENASIVGKTLSEAGLCNGDGFSVLAIQKSNSVEPRDGHYNPPPETVIESNTTLIIFCEPSSITRFRDLAALVS